MMNVLKRIGGALKDAAVHMFGLEAFLGSGTGETKKAAIMDFLKNAIGVSELVLGRDLVDETEFVAGPRSGRRRPPPCPESHEFMA